jgi:hypothetical protein
MWLAGPVFTEWYWTPIFAVIVYGPPVMAVATALYLGTQRTRLRRRSRAAAALLGATALVVGGVQIVGHIRFERAEAREANAIRFATFEPPGRDAKRVEIADGAVHWYYRRDGRYLLASQRAATPEDDVTPPTCRVHERPRVLLYDGPCIGSGGGVVLTCSPLPTAMTIRDGTLIHAYGTADPLAYVGTLRPVDPRRIDYER